MKREQAAALLPKANKTNMVRLIRAKGYVIPSLYRAIFTKGNRAYWLRWEGDDKTHHYAYYSAAAGRPILKVDEVWHDLTMAEVIQFGLVEEK